MTKKINTGVYIHVPFCESRCHYCDFCSSIINKEEVSKYFKYLEKEILMYDDLLKNRVIDTIFIGGGTPSSVDEKYIGNILEILNRYNLATNTEISIESNPNSLSFKKTKAYKTFGINRISIGAQSFNNFILKDIGRIHTKNQIFDAVQNAKDASIKNINLDLMLALPNQTFDDIIDSLKEIKSLDPSHVSYYSLILEKNTKLYKRYQNEKLSFADDYTDRKMYHYIVDGLLELGYKQYEISNFAKDGYKCRHNMKYWHLKDYISFGLSASSNLGNLRYTNYSDFKNYYEALDYNNKPIEFSENLDLKDRLNEFIIMGIRLNDGINIDKLNKRFNIDFEIMYKNEITKNMAKGLIEKNKTNYRLTPLGRDLSHVVELDFFKN